ncbi:MAG: hypothetical protein R2698_00930 [Microthrixaceae bacterium]
MEPSEPVQLVEGTDQRSSHDRGGRQVRHLVVLEGGIARVEHRENRRVSHRFEAEDLDDVGVTDRVEHPRFVLEPCHGRSPVRGLRDQRDAVAVDAFHRDGVAERPRGQWSGGVLSHGR